MYRCSNPNLRRVFRPLRFQSYHQLSYRSYWDVSWNLKEFRMYNKGEREWISSCGSKTDYRIGSSSINFLFYKFPSGKKPTETVEELIFELVREIDLCRDWQMSWGTSSKIWAKWSSIRYLSHKLLLFQHLWYDKAVLFICNFVFIVILRRYFVFYKLFHHSQMWMVP